MARWRTALAGLVCGAVLAAACSSGSDDGPEAEAEAEQTAAVDATSDLTFAVADDVRLVIQPGDFAAAGTVAVTDTDEDGPDVDWFDAAADPVELKVDGQVAAPLTLTFDGTGGPDGKVPVILRFDATEGWYPIAVAGDDGIATAERTSFSPLSWGWAKLQTISDAVADGTRKLLGDRHDPPDCSAGPPSWFSVDPPAVDVVHACATANPDPAGGPDRGEAQIVNNRGVILEVQVPVGAAYAWVEGQPDLIREAVRHFTAQDSVLLAPGERMTVGFTQPATSAYMPLRIDYSGSAAAATAILEAVGDTSAYAAVYKGLAECGAAPEPLDVRLGVDDLNSLVSTAIACFANLASDPQAAATLAAEAVAATNGTTTSVAISDRQLASKVDVIAGKLRFAARALIVVTVGSKVIDAVSDLYLNTDLGDVNSLSPILTLRKPEAPPTPPGPDLGFELLPFRDLPSDGPSQRSFADLLDATGIPAQSEFAYRAPCLTLHVPGWTTDGDFDLFVGYDGTCGGGDSMETFYAVRGGTITIEVSACGDCVIVDDGALARYRAIIDALAGRQELVITLGDVEGSWYVDTVHARPARTRNSG